jgi:MFS family permease
MNSQGTPVMKATTTSVEAERPSTWIERFAIPIAASSMEAQPIALLTLMVAGTNATPPLGAGGVALVALGLLWWAMVVEHIVQRSSRGRRTAWLHFLGWLAAFAVVVGPRLPSLATGESIFAALLGTVLVTWLWRRSMPRAQAGFEYAQFATSFKVGFGVLLGILLVGTVLPDLQMLRDALGSSLPVFFLSGLVGLSLIRLGAIRASRRALDGSQQADPTRTWLLALTLFGVALIAIVIAIESVFSFAAFEVMLIALAPLWNALGTLVGWILYGIIFLLLPLFYLISFLIGLLMNRNAKTQSMGPKPSPIHQPGSPQGIPPEVLAIGRWIFLVLILFVVLLVLRASLRRWRMRRNDEGIEEEREVLDARSLLGEWWREWWNRWRYPTNAMSDLEPLDPTSARARYREMLQALATEKDDLARTPAETPAEYEARLLVHLGNAAPNVQELPSGDRLPPDPAILDELTRAYVSERYGGKLTLQHQRAHLQAWVPYLVARLTGRASPRRPRS